MENKGQWVDQWACRYLQMKGLVLIKSGYRSRYGGIDLIMKDKEVWVFVEVKAAKKNALPECIASIDTKKQQKIIKTSLYFLLESEASFDVRYDVVFVQRPFFLVNWYKGAFDIDSL